MESGTERNEEKEAEDSYNKSNLVNLTAMETNVCAIASVPIVYIKGLKNSYKALLDSGSAVNVICRRLILESKDYGCHVI
ncbi:peptidase aspartic [Nosema bombycis CQ1]|uniref:Peptidase aspartic n=1 Tax=Nosema bombycis (strain CQ1 / CVCC 102059) TaxID=578461 RepID=R0KW51_NOSB1|nr:peptidase aspartic [Nosema bombycis CQ1]|eukprot:EOB15136.1 peptidase aspartic [Nosema bombycis CQ1]